VGIHTDPRPCIHTDPTDPAYIQTPDPAYIQTPDPAYIQTPDPAYIQTPDPAYIQTYCDREHWLWHGSCMYIKARAGSSPVAHITLLKLSSDTSLSSPCGCKHYMNNTV